MRRGISSPIPEPGMAGAPGKLRLRSSLLGWLSAGTAAPARGALRRRLRNEQGQGLVELGLALPVLLAIMSAIIDGGWAFHQAGMVAAAAEAAGRAVAIQDTGAGHCTGSPPDSYEGVAQRAAQAAAPGLNPEAVGVAVGYLEPACNGRMRTLVVSIKYPVSALTPWLAPLLAGRRLTAQAGSAVEEVPPPWWGQADEVQAQQAQIQAQEAQIASLTAAYQSVAGQVQGQQAEISSLSAAYQAENTQAVYWSQTAGYYYSQWQSALSARGGGYGGDISTH